MTREENIRAILECNFAGYKEEIIENAVKRICELEQKTKEEILMIKINAMMDDEYKKKFRENIIKQKETGVVILPYYAEAIITPSDIEIKINNEESEV